MEAGGNPSLQRLLSWFSKKGFSLERMREGFSLSFLCIGGVRPEARRAFHLQVEVESLSMEDRTGECGKILG